MSAKTKLRPLAEQVMLLGGDCEAIDTSFLYEELRRNFIRTGEHVDVDFRQLVGWMRLGDQLTHQIHPYPAKLLPHIAHFFVRASTLHHKDRIVLDPFCGSGTVALEASLAGYTPFVADANPLALLLTKVKTRPYDVEGLRNATKLILSRASRFRTAPTVSIVNDHLWYLPRHKRALEIVLRAIREVEDSDQRDFFRVCLSVTARRLSFADPAVSVPVRLRTKDTLKPGANAKIKDRLRWIEGVYAVDEFAKVCAANIQRVENANSINGQRREAKGVGVDARDLVQPELSTKKQLKSNSIPFLLTSPPYGSAQKYIRASSLSLNWLEMTPPKGLSELEGKSIGREHMPKFREQKSVLLPKVYEGLLQKIQMINHLRASITRQYLVEMREVVKEVARVVAPGGHVVFVVGNNQVCGETLRNDDYLIDCFRDHEMELELALIDHIKSRGLMTKRNRTASVISREVVLVFKK